MKWYTPFGAALLAACFVLFLPGPSAGQPATTFLADYLLLSDIEQTEFGEIIWFYERDLVVGPIRTNGSFAIKNSPVFLDHVLQSGNNFVPGPGFNPQFLGPEPILSVPTFSELTDPHTVEELALAANGQGNYYHNDEGNRQTRIEAQEQGLLLEQWAAGVAYDPEEILFTEMIPYGIGKAVFAEGRLEVFGTHFQGMMTIACDGDMYLIDNVLYQGYFIQHFQPLVPDLSLVWQTPTDLDQLALVAAGNILVANTPANGQGNGRDNGEWEDHSNKHIVITAAMYAEGGSFSFENQNNHPDDPYGWDGYWWCDPQGDHPNQRDERGAIFFHGAIAFAQRGYVHRSNCAGTGYDKYYLYDHRFRGGDYPGLYTPQLVETNEQAVVWQDTVVTMTSANDRILPQGDYPLVLGPGTVLEVDATSALWDYPIWGGRLRIEGSEENPVRINIAGQVDGRPFRFVRGSEVGIDWSHAVITSDVPLELQVPLHLSHFQIEAPEIYLEGVRWTLGTSIEECTFKGRVVVNRDYPVDRFERNVIIGTLAATTPSVTHCTFARYPGAGDLAFEFTRSPNFRDGPRTIRNTVFEGAYTGLFTTNTLEGSIDYSAWHGNSEPIEFDPEITVGENNLIGLEPLFWDAGNDDFHLQADSPLIDAGDPDSPADPDGSRADIGAYPYDPNYTDVSEGDPSNGLPLAFRVEKLYPNPFNGMATLTMTLPQAGKVVVTVYDIMGRQVAVLHEGVMAVGRHSLSVDLASRPSGLYFVVAQTGSERAVAKAMLVK